MSIANQQSLSLGAIHLPRKFSNSARLFKPNLSVRYGVATPCRAVDRSNSSSYMASIDMTPVPIRISSTGRRYSRGWVHRYGHYFLLCKTHQRLKAPNKRLGVLCPITSAIVSG